MKRPTPSRRRSAAPSLVLGLLVRWFAATDSPRFVSLNEVCSAHAEQVGAAIGMTRQFVDVTTHEDCPVDSRGERRFGIAHFYRDRPLSGMSGWYQTQPDVCVAPQQPAPSRCMGFACVRVDTGGGAQQAGCTSHLYASDTGIAADQSAEYMTWATGFHGGTRVLAGDFNLLSGQIDSSFARNCMVDSTDHHFTFDAVQGLDRKIDYIWHCTGAAIPPFDPPRRQCAPNYSDHCYVFMKLTAVLRT